MNSSYRLRECISAPSAAVQVFKAIWEEMQGPVHAVDRMELKAPSEV